MGWLFAGPFFSRFCMKKHLINSPSLTKQIVSLLFLSFLTIPLFAEELYYYRSGEKVLLHPSEHGKHPAASRSVRFFTDESGAELGASDEIIFKIAPGHTVERVVEKYGLELIRPLPGNAYLVRVKDPALLFEISNRLYEEKAALYAHPNFIRRINLR